MSSRAKGDAWSSTCRRRTGEASGSRRRVGEPRRVDATSACSLAKTQFAVYSKPNGGWRSSLRRGRPFLTRPTRRENVPLKDTFKSILGGPGGKLNVKSRFELLREAISGTMSQVYMARDRRNDQIVALKILDAEKTSFFEGRFKGLKKPSEGAIAIKFDHPNIVKTHEHGLTTSGAQYIVMEYLQGAGLELCPRHERWVPRRSKSRLDSANCGISESRPRGRVHSPRCLPKKSPVCR